MPDVRTLDCLPLPYISLQYHVLLQAYYSDEALEILGLHTGCPRIIASPETTTASATSNPLRLPDVVVTHLYKWNQDALPKFLDLHRGKFEYVLERPGQLTLLIARLGQKIVIQWHSDGYISGAVTINYLLSTTGEWKPTFGYMDLSATYEASKIDAYAEKFANDLIEMKGWTTDEGKEHRVQWTKLPGEKDYRVPYDEDQQKFYGLPAGWDKMTDQEVADIEKARTANQPWEDRDKWAYELIEPTVC
ncbi:hypothetical protein FIBSPDRAFT_975090 [Athelia psychrophila]|uniref:Uncharacterized protein n=1 Tax=Athelia psychrophila TaxID=1759441 RepID=A0A166FJ22_9AGAM|nr:hypothetical protein FIBSPDRAFT_975090 [Fibularhizoctonia sp. CBS 109695]